MYDTEHRLTSVSGAARATFVYDGRACPERSRRGNRVKATFGSTTTVYVGAIYERDNGSTVRKYYYAGGVRVATPALAPKRSAGASVRTGGQTYYLLGDHLGGTNVTYNSSNGQITKLLYKPWGETRFSTGTTPTTWRFTGQREDATIGLYYFNARYLDPQLGRFTQPDTIVPEPGDPQALNRYSYVLNNPLRYTDPSGNAPQYPGDPDPNNAACGTDWCWQNRWYMAHNYHWDGGGWSLGQLGAAVFYDPGILTDVLAEAGIAAAGAWDFGELSLVGQGVVDLMNTVGSPDRLRSLFDPPGLFQGSPSVKLKRGTTGWGTCTGMGACSLYNTVWFFDALFRHADDWIRATAVHELGHIIDHKHMARQASFISQSFPGYGDPQFRLTDYGRTDAFEYWAEAVTIWVYGNRYKGPGGVFAEQDRGILSALQVSFVETWLGGR